MPDEKQDETSSSQTAGGPEKSAELLEIEEMLERADAISSVNADESEKLLRKIIAKDTKDTEEDGLVKVKERAIYKLAEVLAKQGKTAALSSLLTDLRTFFEEIPKAKTAKIVRTLIDRVAEVPNSTQKCIDLCKESMEWCKSKKRNFLRQRIEARLCAFYLDTKQYTVAIKAIQKVISEVKRVDDKKLLVELFLVESRIQEALRNIPKAKASLVACRANAASIYVPPLLQAQIDIQAGRISAEEKDFKTSFSYFFEAFEGYDSMNKKTIARSALKYMLLSKIMMDKPKDVDGIIRGKLALKYAGPSVDAMKAVAKAYVKRSVRILKEVIAEHKAEIFDDPVIRNHLSSLEGSLLEKNLLKILQPYSRVELARIAQLINLPVKDVETRISLMILDGTFRGILDQGNASVIVFDDEPENQSYTHAIQTLESMEGAADQLFEKAKRLSG